MRKLKIIQILPSLNTGGVERGVLDFNKYLVEKGHQSYVISNGGRQVKNLINEGGEHIHMQISKKVYLHCCKQKNLLTLSMRFHQILFIFVHECQLGFCNCQNYLLRIPDH